MIQRLFVKRHSTDIPLLQSLDVQYQCTRLKIIGISLVHCFTLGLRLDIVYDK